MFILVGLGLMYLLPLMLLINTISNFHIKTLNTTGTQVHNTRPGGPQYIIDPLTGDYRQKDTYPIQYVKPPAPSDIDGERERYMDHIQKSGIRHGDNIREY